MFVCCERLGGLLGCLREQCGRLGETFPHDVSISGPRYKIKEKREVCLLNVLLGSAKMAIWRTWKNKLLGVGSIDSSEVFKGMVQTVLNQICKL